jgi:dipeptidyl aminopeptidase/acylaminoacyl peptidase
VFDDLDAYIAAPRVTGLVLSPDGTRLACSVQTLSDDSAKYVTALWDVDIDGAREPRRLTRSVNGESSPAFLPNGDLLFISKRPNDEKLKPDDEKPSADDVSALWLLPAAGGEANLVAKAASSISSVVVARDSGAIFVTRDVLPGDANSDGVRRKARKEAGVTAVLHEVSPVRHWDHDLGPGQPRLFALDRTGSDRTFDLRDLTPTPGQGLEETGIAVSADGSQVAIGWRTQLGRGL